MKRLKFVIWDGVVIAGALLLSCDTIQGDLELLVDEETSTWLPAWSFDGSEVYYIFMDESPHRIEGELWKINVETGKTEQVSPQKFTWFSIAPDDNLLAASWEGWIRIIDLEDWTQVDSLLPNEDIQPNNVQPVFSYENSLILYYTHNTMDSVYLRRINRNTGSDEVLLRKGLGDVYAPGPGDSLVAVWDTIYNLNTGERIPIGIEPRFLYWNPAKTSELLICTWVDQDLYIFDVESKKKKRININIENADRSNEARFSPNGKQIVFSIEEKGLSWVSRIWLFNLSD